MVLKLVHFFGTPGSEKQINHKFWPQDYNLPMLGAQERVIDFTRAQMYRKDMNLNIQSSSRDPFGIPFSPSFPIIARRG